MSTETEPPDGGIRISSSGGPDGCLDIKGLTQDEIEQLKGAFEHGSWWARVRREDGGEPEDQRLVVHPVFEQFPDPVADEKMRPFWREFDPPAEGQLQIFPLEALREHSSPSITIQHLCGYGYTPEKYADEAAKLTRWGFVQMRSPRGSDGKYWEHWLLPGLWSAAEELRVAIDGTGENDEPTPRLRWDEDPPPPTPPRPAGSPKEQLERAVRFLARHASFGSLEFSVQRLAMVLD